MATVPSTGHTLTNASFLYDFSECLFNDSWKAAECDCVPVSGSEHKCSITPSCRVSFVPGKWYRFNEDLHCNNLSEPQGTITHCDLYQFDEELVRSLQPEFVMSFCDAEHGESVGGPEQDPEASGATVKVKRYKAMVNNLLGGKYQLKQNANGFTLHSTKPTDHCVWTLPPQLEIIDLNEVICQAGEKIQEISGIIMPADDINSQVAATIWKIQLAHEESAQIYDPTLWGPHPTVEITEDDWKRGESMWKYLTNLKCKQEDKYCTPQQYCMMAVPIDRMAQLGVLPCESFDTRNMMFMMPLMTPVAENMVPFCIATQQTHKWLLLTGHLALYKLYCKKRCWLLGFLWAHSSFV